MKDYTCSFGRYATVSTQHFRNLIFLYINYSIDDNFDSYYNDNDDYPKSLQI